jgi:hypothetical protein
MSDKGFKDLLWFMGVVEDNNDPQKLGRAKVRCFGFHTEDKSLLPTEDLPWAYAISGNYSSAITVPQLNTWVWGFFLDGKFAQQPMLIGMMMGMPTMPPYPNEGFATASDPVNLCDSYQPDMSRLSRAEQVEQTSVAFKNITATSNVITADGTSWSQPNSPYNARYPHNFVHETKAGHVFELDDTPGSERINLYHTSGSYVEMDSNGTTVIKSGGNMYMIVEANGRISIDGDYSVTTTGSMYLLAKNDMVIKVDGNLKTTVGGNYELNVAGYMNTNVGEAIRTRGLSMALESQNNFDIYSGVEMRLGGQIISAKSSGALFLNSVTGNVEIKSGVDTNIYGASNVNLKSATKANIQSGEINIKGTTVNIDNLVNMANGDAGTAALAASGLNVSRTELPSSDVPTKNSPVKKTAIAPESGGLDAVDDTADYTSPEVTIFGAM